MSTGRPLVAPKTLKVLSVELARVFGQREKRSAPVDVDKAHTRDEIAGSRLPAELEQRLEEIAALPPNWDGYGAQTPSMIAVEAARNVLSLIDKAIPWASEALFLAPSTSGGMRLEWAVGDRELVVIIPASPESDFELYRSNDEKGFEEDRSEPDLSRLPDLLNWLAAG